MNKTLSITGHITKDFRLEKEDDSVWAMASVEIVDSGGDLIKVSGISTSDYHSPPSRHMKVLAGHEFMLADGTPAIVGRIEEFRQIKTLVAGEMVPALAFRMSFSKDGDGNITPLAKTYKDLFDGEYLDSFSVGISFMMKDAETNKSGGLNISKATLYEVSAVAVPANKNANVLKTVKDMLSTVGVFKEVKEATDIDFIHHDQDGSKWVSYEKHKEIIDIIKSVKVEPCGIDNILKAIESMLGTVAKSVNDLVTTEKSVLERLDILESATVLIANAAISRSDQTQKVGVKEEAKQILGTLEKLNKFLDK